MRRLSLALIASLPAEIGVLRRSIDDLGEAGEARDAGEHRGTPGAWMGRLEGLEVAILLTGLGALRAEENVSALLGELEIDRALTVGFGGGLSESLGPGDLLVAREVVSLADPGAAFTSDPVLFDLAHGLPDPPCQLSSGRVVTADRVVRGVAEKRQLHRTAQADVVDMESFGSARALARAGVPSLFVRCVVDEAGFDFSLDPARLVDPAGRPRWMAILLEVLRRPSRALVLRSLAVRSRRAAANLAWLCHGVASGLARRESEGTAET